MAGISKWQWLLILTATAVVILINVVGIRYYLLPAKSLAEKITDPEALALIVCDYPYTAVSLKFLVAAASLGTSAWLIVFSSTRAFFQGLPSILKYGSELLMAVLAGAVFTTVSILLSNSWVGDFWCGSALYGLMQSGFVRYWSPRLVFPATSVLMFWAMYLSKEAYLRTSHNARD